MRPGIKGVISATAEELVQRWVRDYQEAARRHGRAPELGGELILGLRMCIDDTEERAIERARPYFEEHAKVMAPLGMLRYSEEHARAVAARQPQSPTSAPGERRAQPLPALRPFRRHRGLPEGRGAALPGARPRHDRLGDRHAARSHGLAAHPLRARGHTRLPPAGNRLSVDDLVIRGGMILDGTGAEPVRGDVAVRDGRIAAITPRHSGPARRVVDADGLVVAPGFIDIKTHSDFTLSRAESKIWQGVTTEVVGHCGFSLAPVVPGRARPLREYLAGFAPWIETRETTFAAYMDDFPPTAVNTVMQVGHNTLRLMTVGLDDRAPTDDELAAMRRLLAEGLAAGALGMWSGLFTAPGSFARPSELHGLLGVVRQHGGAYATHLRSESDAVFEAVREAIEASEVSACTSRSST